VSRDFLLPHPVRRLSHQDSWVHDHIQTLVQLALHRQCGIILVCNKSSAGGQMTEEEIEIVAEELAKAGRHSWSPGRTGGDTAEGRE
jgi:hypothetical protein